MYGWKGRIGLLIPKRCTTMEPELARLVPEGVSVHAHRIDLQETTLAELGKMQKGILHASRVVGAIGADVIVLGCTTSSMLGGPAYDVKIMRAMTRVTGTPAITTATAVVRALKRLKVQKVAIGTPYTDEVNELLRQFLEVQGLKVVSLKGLGYSKSISPYPLARKPVSGTGLLEPAVAYRLGCDVDNDEAEAILLSCTNLRTIEIIGALEKNRGKPVVTSNQATLSLALEVMGIKEPVAGFGRLLDGAVTD
jgi:maleate isomerase